MTLRVRLILTFVLVVLVPLIVGAFLVSTYFPRVNEDEAIERIGGQRDATAGLVQQLCERARAAAEQLGPSVNTPAATSVAKSLVERSLADVARVEDGQGRTVVSVGSVPGAPAGARLRDCRNGSEGVANVVASRLTVQVAGQPDRYAEAGLVLDQDLVTRLARAVHADVTFVADGRPVVSSLGAAGARQAARLAAGAVERPRVLDGRLVSAQDPAPFVPTGFVLTTDPPRTSSGVLKIMLPLLVACLLLALLFARQLARVTTLPLAELSDAAERVAGGDLGVRIPVRRQDEVGRLGTSFNAMTEQLRAKVDALQDSRDELRRNVARLGDTLSSTHDLTRILEVILDTAMASTGAQAGAVLLTAHGRGDLYLKVGRGLEERGITDTFRVRIGQGVSGSVAASGEPLRGRPGNRPGDLRPTPEEPHATNVISVPFRSTGRVLGVLNLYDRLDAEEFDEADLVTIRTFASQAAVAVDNVLLHQEAQRLSITDGLTGVPNYRYFTINFAREIERAARFRRPLALLMLDIDHFKSVNDSYGHQRGDAVLVELAARVRAEIREVDMLARYGGEEFVLVLPETDVQGGELTAERICDVIRRRPFDHDDSPLSVTISIGVAVFPEHGATAATLLRRADEALYAAKASGRNRWRVAAPEETPTAPAALDGAEGGNGAVEQPRPVGTGRTPRDG